MSETLDPEAVFWDIGGVIVDLESIRAGHRDFVDSLLETYRSPLPPAEALETWRSVLGEYFRGGDGTTYRPARDGYEQAVDAILADDVDDPDWQPMFHEIHDDHVSAHPGAVETIHRIAETEIHQGVISDVDHDEGRRLLESLGVWEAFDAYTSSEEVGRKKPDPEIFEVALEKASVAAANAVMIGDRYANDMEGGSAAGMTTVAYGADDGAAVDYRIDDLRDLLPLLGLEEPATDRE